MGEARFQPTSAAVRASLGPLLTGVKHARLRGKEINW